MHSFDLSLEDISKIEGKASLTIKVRNGEIKDLKFRIDEYKRFYTQAIRNKDVLGLPQLTARICGTCSNAHLMCAIKAIENALGIMPSTQTKILRKLVNFGLIIRDHALHLYVFALPDILGIDNILDLDETDKYQHQLLDDTFLVKSAGNLLSKEIGGRSVHAPYPTIDGFTKLPKEESFPHIIKKLKEARPAVLRLIKIFNNCKFKLDTDADFISMVDSTLSFLDGEIVKSDIQKTEESDIKRYISTVEEFTSVDNKSDIGRELRVSEDEFGNLLEHKIIEYSHASGYKFIGKVYMIGALSRLNLGKKYIHPETQQDAGEALSHFPSKNIFHNNLAQAIEILHSIDSAVDLLASLKIKKETPQIPERKESIGIGIIEAPRGTLYYKLEINEQGKIKNGQIIVPTGQNQIGIEKSILKYLKENLSKDREVITHEIEKIIRAFDPCMSCASHFLKVNWI